MWQQVVYILWMYIDQCIVSRTYHHNKLSCFCVAVFKTKDSFKTINHISWNLTCVYIHLNS